MTKLNKTQSQKLTKIFLASFEAEKVLPSFKVEYEEVGFWHGLWLKITKQEPPVIYPPFPVSEGDTVTFKRPYRR